MKRQTLSRTITGLVMLALGVAFLLSSLQVINIDTLIHDYWPLAIMAAGVLVLVNNIRSWPVGAFLLALGGLYQLRVMEVINVEPWPMVWPLILIFVGVSVLFGRSYNGKRVSKSDRDDVMAILAGVEVVNHSKVFKQSNATAIMGGARIDLRQAEFADDAVVDVLAMWGDVEIIVPEHVAVRNQVTNILAGTEDKTKQKTTKASPTLVITGMAIMGGVEIKNTPSS